MLILPCNAGAALGNYFLSPSWQRADKLLRARSLRAFTTLAAIDSIITIYDPSRDRSVLGAIVLETEMHRVAGYDAYPGLEKFLKNRALFEELKRDVEVGIIRLRREGYNEVYATLWVAAYQAALYEALLKLGGGRWPSWATMVLAPPSPLVRFRCVNLAVRCLEERLLGVRTLHAPHLKAWSEFWARRGRELGVSMQYDCLL